MCRDRSGRRKLPEMPAPIMMTEEREGESIVEGKRRDGRRMSFFWCVCVLAIEEEIAGVSLYNFFIIFLFFYFLIILFLIRFGDYT